MALPAYTVLTKVSLSCTEMFYINLDVTWSNLDANDVWDGGNIQLSGETWKNWAGESWSALVYELLNLTRAWLTLNQQSWTWPMCGKTCFYNSHHQSSIVLLYYQLTAMICVYLNWFCAETRRGMRCSGRNPVKAGESASKTWEAANVQQVSTQSKI